MEDIRNKLAEWKEKILFGIVVLTTLMVVTKAEPMGGGVSDIDAEVRVAAIKAAGIDQETASMVLTKLENPGEFTPSRPDDEVINSVFFGERAEYRRSGPSAYMLSGEEYQGLPPLQLTVPGFPSLPDYDIPAGPRPLLSRVDRALPRDNRPVDLTGEER